MVLIMLFSNFIRMQKMTVTVNPFLLYQFFDLPVFGLKFLSYHFILMMAVYPHLATLYYNHYRRCRIIKQINFPTGHPCL